MLSTKNKRMSITLPQNLLERLDKLKKEEYYNKSYSEMVRGLLEDSLSKADLSNPDPETKKAI